LLPLLIPVKSNEIQGVLVVEIENHNSAWLSKSARKFLAEEATAYTPLETGGVLMGYFSEQHNIPVILYATGAGPEAIHFSNFYKPDYDYDCHEVAKIYEQPTGRITYLGDWHTHIASYGGLSFLDKCTLRRIAKCKTARVKNPIMLILSYNKQWEFTIWQGKPKKNRLLYKRLSIRKLKINLFE